MEGMGIPPEFADRMGEFVEAMDRGELVGGLLIWGWEGLGCAGLRGAGLGLSSAELSRAVLSWAGLGWAEFTAVTVQGQLHQPARKSLHLRWARHSAACLPASLQCH